MTRVTKMNVTRVIPICYPRDWSIKLFVPILPRILHKRHLYDEHVISEEARKGRMKMRFFAITLIALIVGFFIGLTLSEVIGIVGFLGFGRVIRIKYLPVYTAIALAILANFVDRSLRSKSGKA
jgi:hypothetical protein